MITADSALILDLHLCFIPSPLIPLLSSSRLPLALFDFHFSFLLFQLFTFLRLLISPLLYRRRARSTGQYFGVDRRCRRSVTETRILCICIGLLL